MDPLFICGWFLEGNVFSTHKSICIDKLLWPEMFHCVCHINAYILLQNNLLSLLMRASGMAGNNLPDFSKSGSVQYHLHTSYMARGEKRRGYETGRLGLETHMHFLMSALKKLRCIYISREEKGRSVWAPSYTQ